MFVLIFFADVIFHQRQPFTGISNLAECEFSKMVNLQSFCDNGWFFCKYGINGDSHLLDTWSSSWLLPSSKIIFFDWFVFCLLVILIGGWWTVDSWNHAPPEIYKPLVNGIWSIPIGAGCFSINSGLSSVRSLGFCLCLCPSPLCELMMIQTLKVLVNSQIVSGGPNVCLRIFSCILYTVVSWSDIDVWQNDATCKIYNNLMHINIPDDSTRDLFIPKHSPNVGSHLTFEFGSCFHHLKEVTSRIARY